MHPKLTTRQVVELPDSIRAAVATLLDLDFHVVSAAPKLRKEPARIEVETVPDIPEDVLVIAHALHDQLSEVPDGPWMVEAKYTPHNKLATLTLLGVAAPETANSEE